MFYKFIGYIESDMVAGIDCSLQEMLNHCDFLDYEQEEISEQELNEIGIETK